MLRFSRVTAPISALKLPPSSINPTACECPCGGDCPCGDDCPGGDDCPCTH